MNLTLIFVILCLTVMVVVQHWALEDQRNYATYWHRSYKLTVDAYDKAYTVLNSPLQRKMQKAYRSQLKKAYKKQYRGVFATDPAHGANNRGYFLHTLAEAQNQRHWIETIRGYGAPLAGYRPGIGEQAIRASNHKRYLKIAKGFLYISPKLP